MYIKIKIAMLVNHSIKMQVVFAILVFIDAIIEKKNMLSHLGKQTYFCYLECLLVQYGLLAKKRFHDVSS